MTGISHSNTRMEVCRRARLLVLLSLVAIAATANAQEQATPDQPPSEEIEPRVIGTPGTMMVGFAGYVDRFGSPDNELPTNYTAQIDVGRFITRGFVVGGGLVGTGRLGEDADDVDSGSGAPALHLFTGVLYYLTPHSMVSLYSGGEYWVQLTRRAGEDAGSMVGKLGVQAVVSSRASLFLEGGYGVGLTRNDDEELVSRFIGRVGVRLKF